MFADLSEPEPGVPNGRHGRQRLLGGAGGIWIIDPKGRTLSRIVHGEVQCEPSTTNIAFGGGDWKTPYFTTRSTLGSVKLKIGGTPVPVESG